VGVRTKELVADDAMCFCAAWRRLRYRTKHARGCSWLGQRGGCDCFRLGRIVSCDVTCSRDLCLLLS
jgi:hypothetical protein